MGKITQHSMLDLLYNRKLPKVYRDEDSKIGFPLKRYLESLIEGGYYGNIKDIEGIMTLIDPMTVPEEFFPYLCESFGFKYFPDIDISYQRRFLSNIGELNKRRGTFSSVHYLTRSLTGLDSEITYSDGLLNILLLAKNLEQLKDIDTSMTVISRYIGSQIPFYIRPVITSKVDASIIYSSPTYCHSVVGSYKSYTIKSKGSNSGGSSSGGSSSDSFNSASILGEGVLGNFILGG